MSVRGVANAAGTTTRAVYSLFGSKEGLLAAIARSAFDDLTRRLEDLPLADDPADDLVQVGIDVFRRFVLERPSLFRIAFQRIVPGLTAEPELVQARHRTFRCLVSRFEPLAEAGRLAGRDPTEAAVEFNAICEGLANAELRGQILNILPHGREEEAWRNALTTLIQGLERT